MTSIPCQEFTGWVPVILFHSEARSVMSSYIKYKIKKITSKKSWITVSLWISSNLFANITGLWKFFVKTLFVLFIDLLWEKPWSANTSMPECCQYSRTCLERPPLCQWKYGLARQVVFGGRFNYIEMKTFCPKLLVLQDKLSLMSVAFQDRFHCNGLKRVCLIFSLTSQCPSRSDLPGVKYWN